MDGQPRAVDGDGNCTEVREMGADELVPGPPTASFAGGPAEGATVVAAGVRFDLASTYSCAPSFECSIDGGAFAACTSPLTLTGLADGPHSLAVRALDLIPQTGPVVTRGFSTQAPAAQPQARKRCKKGFRVKKVKKKRKCVKKKKRRKGSRGR
jgi:hypothetical protein